MSLGRDIPCRRPSDKEAKETAYRNNRPASFPNSPDKMLQSSMSHPAEIESLDSPHNENPPAYNHIIHNREERYSDLESMKMEQEHGESPSEGGQYRHPIDNQTHVSRPLPIIIPTETAQLSSGFPYCQDLHSANISSADWNIFTSQILSVTHLSIGEKSLYWGTAVGVGIVAGSMFFILGAVPAYFAGRAVKRRVQEKKVLDESVTDILERWNAEFFTAKGLAVRMAVPQEAIGTEERMRVQQTKFHGPSLLRERTLSGAVNKRFKLIIQSR